MKNLIIDDFDEDEEIDIDVEEELEKIQLRSQAESVLKNIQITKTKHFKKDIKKIVKYYIKKFFKKHSKIDINTLYSKNNIEKVFNTNILNSTKAIYEFLKDTSYAEKSTKERDVTKDVILVNESLKKIYKAKIPQQFAGGMLLLYLEVCRGIKIEA